MRSTIILTLLAFGAACILPSPLLARRIEAWPFSRLFKEAELVVIAEAVSTVETRDTLKNVVWKAPFQGLDTKFEVQSVLKGERPDELKVLHFSSPTRRLENGPLLVAFQTAPLRLDVKQAEAKVADKTLILPRSLLAIPRPQYLLFLKKRQDGRYELVSGQIDPKLAVREVREPGLWDGFLGR